MVQNRYLIVQMIGSGGVGEVYLAVDQWSGNAVAVKRVVFGSDSALGTALEAEAKPLMNLRHPVLPKVNDGFIEDGQYFLVMEHMSGPDLATRLEESKKPFPVSWCMFWADQLLDAISYLHSHSPSIIHGDIKPANLKLTDENHIVLLDKGLVLQHPSTTADGERRSDPYASIEQVKGNALSPASDVYSFAATFYQLISNIVPPDSRKRADAVRSGLPDPLIPLSKANPGVSPDIAEVLEKGLAIDPDHRFGEAAEMQRSLRRAYKKLQEATTARTVEYSQSAIPVAEVKPSETPGVTRPSVVTEVRAAGGALVGDAVTEVAKAGEPTVEMGAANNAGKQSDVQTEAYSANTMASAVTEVNPKAAQPTVNYQNAPSAATVPAAAAAGFAQGQPQAPKRSSKAGLIFGGLFALLFLAGIAAAGGWFLYKNYQAAKVVSTPTPAPTPQVTITPAEQLEVNTNTNVVTTTPEVSNSNTDTNSNKGTVASSTPVQVRPVQPPPDRKGTVRTSQPPTSKPTAKPKSGDDRTVILQ
jgi:serine/threonine-protein kinase